ncbi:NAD-binding protein, partial [Chloroflexota bacterium]
MARFPKLFQPGRIGTLEVRNRIVMPAMGTFTADSEGYITDRTIDYHVERVKGGVGLIITQAVAILSDANTPYIMSLYDDKFIPRLKELSHAVHQYGASIALQLAHRGMAGSLFYDPKEAGEINSIGPSAVNLVETGLTGKELTREDISHMVEAYAEGARRAKEAGFDAIEFHGAHGYLISNFLSGYTNRRSDEYGGTPEKRARFACEILKRTREKVGPDFPVIFRFSGADFLPNGITLEDTLIQAPMLVEAGANALHVSASAQETTEWQFLSYLWPDGAIVYLAEAVKKVVNVPVITVGKLSDPLVAERILEEGKADFVAMGRGLLADPELPNKAKQGRLDDIRRCIYCNNCRLFTSQERVRFGGTLCTVNPAICREREFALKPTAAPKKVMVIGGGLAGMEASRVLAERGHQVNLYERSDRLGGQWNIACQLPLKEGFANVTRYLSKGMDKAGVNVVLNKEVTPELVK